MRYQSVNHLRDFEFHDAEWTLVSHNGKSLVGDVKYLNVHQDAEQNTADCDMEIENARITLTGCRVIACQPVSPLIVDAEGVRHPDPDEPPPVTCEGENAAESLSNEMKNGMTFYSFEEDEDGAWRLVGCGETPIFKAKIAFESALVEWDSFGRPAWYVLHSRGIQA